MACINDCQWDRSLVKLRETGESTARTGRVSHAHLTGEVCPSIIDIRPGVIGPQGLSLRIRRAPGAPVMGVPGVPLNKERPLKPLQA
jgi:hypothetical protein